MSKKKTDPICLHDGGRRDDNTWGGCLLATHEKCDPSKCDDYTKPPSIEEPETERHM